MYCGAMHQRMHWISRHHRECKYIRDVVSSCSVCGILAAPLHRRYDVMSRRVFCGVRCRRAAGCEPVSPRPLKAYVSTVRRLTMDRPWRARSVPPSTASAARPSAQEAEVKGRAAVYARNIFTVLGVETHTEVGSPEPEPPSLRLDLDLASQQCASGLGGGPHKRREAWSRTRARAQARVRIRSRREGGKD